MSTREINFPAVFERVAFYPTVFAVFCVAWIVYQRFWSPLAGIPGPFWASVSRLWYLHRIGAKDMHRYTKSLHKKYGPLVRIAPDEVSCSEPAAMRTIYAVHGGFTKTDWYSALAANMSTHGDSFSELDEKRHSGRRRLINGVFSMNSVLESETYIDNVSCIFFQRMSEFSHSKRVVDMGQWLHFYASDVICELFFGCQFGFVAEGKDIGGYIDAVDTILPYTVKVGTLPAWVRPLQYILPLSSSFRLALSRFETLATAARRLVDARADVEKDCSDMLGKLLAVCRSKAPTFDITDVYTESYTAIFVGSDTVACALRSTIYHLCRNPTIYARVLEEIDTFHKAGQLSDYITYAEALKLDYTVATIKEAMRVHPSAALTYPRYVPKGGAIISGYSFPEGYRVGVNPYVLHYDSSTFGDDAEEFNPDRWFRPGANAIERCMFQFGAGTRICIGKNIALVELYKFIPQFLRKFKVELVNPDQEWIEHNSWFVKQTGINCLISKR